MRKLYLLFIAMLCNAMAFSKTVTEDSAKIVGANYLSRHGVVVNANDLQLTYTANNGQANSYYVFSGTKSFVIVSANDVVKPILAYSKEGAFKTNTPGQIKSWLDNYSNQIYTAVSSNATASVAATQQWSDLKSNATPLHSTAKTTGVNPLLSTTWDQSPDYVNENGFYNDNCPYDYTVNANCVTGCVATATAQVMKFWNWPTQGVGSNSYVTSSYGTLYANYGNTTYDWTSMPNSLTGHNAAVAGLMSDVGISVDMQYSPEESGSYVLSSENGTPPNCAEYALKTYFKYDPSLHGEARDFYDDATWIGMLETNISAGEPVIYCGDGTAGGHCFVFDGYDDNDNFHVNWGWSGLDDGYYAIDALNPPSLGTGGGAGGFNSDQGAIFGIKPDTTTTPTTGSGITSGMYLVDYLQASAYSIPYSSPFSVTTNVGNFSSSDYSGYIGAAAFNSAGTLVGFIQAYAIPSLPSGYDFSPDLTFSTNGMLSMLPGTYDINIYYFNSADSQWIAVGDTDGYINDVQITVTNSNYLELYDTMLTTPATLVQNAAASVSLNIGNFDAVAHSGTLDLSLFTADSGVEVCTIAEQPYSLDPNTAYQNDLVFSTPSLNAAPGTYIMALEFSDGASNWYLAGSDLHQNPILVNVAAPPLTPDIYEPNNDAASAFTFPLTFNGNVASVNTTGSNFHITSDQDYYKIDLPTGYGYTINARLDDSYNTDDNQAYTIDATWSYSTDGGSTWSSSYDDVLDAPIILPNGGSVIFHVTPKFLGNMGTYLFKIGSVTRTPLAVPDVSISDAVQVYPNPANDIVTIDLSNADAQGISASISSIDGKKLFTANLGNKEKATIPVNNLAAGMYLMEVQTNKGNVIKKITVSR